MQEETPYQTWEQTRTYKVIRAKRISKPEEKYETELTVMADGLPWDRAKAMSTALEAAERAAKPHETSWTRDVFYCDLETPWRGYSR